MNISSRQVCRALFKPACLTFTFLFLANLIAQNHHLKFNHLSHEQGLSSTQNNRFVYHDSKGLVWVSASGGLNCFSGQQNRIYQVDPADSTALIFPISASSQFQEDKNGDLWFSNTLALLQYDRDEDAFRRHRIILDDGTPLKNEYYWSFLDTLTNLAYICADKKLYVADRDSIAQGEFLLNRNVSSESEMGVGAAGKRFLLGNYAGSPYFTVDEIIGRSVLRSDTIFTKDSAEVNITLFIKETEVYIGTNLGLRVYNLKTGSWRNTKPNNGQLAEDVRSLALRNNDELFVATSLSGIYMYNRSQLQRTGKVKPHFAARDTVFHPAVYNIFIDQADNLWVVTISDGIFYGSLKKQKFDLLLSEVNGCEHFSEGKDGAIWINSRFGIYHLTDQGNKFYSLPIDGEEVEVLTFIHEAESGEVWAGSLEWLFKLDPVLDSFVKVNYLPEEMDNLPGYICFWERPDGVMLFGTNDRAILALEPGAAKGHWIETPFSGIVSLFENDDLFYASTTAGDVYIGQITPDTFLMHSRHELSTTVTAIKPYLDSDTLLAASFGGIFTISSQDDVTKVDKIFDIPDNGAQSLEVDTAGNVWLAGPAGLFCYSPRKETLRGYQTSDGLQSQSYFYDASLKLADGSMLFGGSKGANSFDPTIIRSTIAPAKPDIVEIDINGDKHKFQEFSNGFCRNPRQVFALTMPYEFNNIELQLSALEYAEPGKCQFGYTLENQGDGRFIELGTSPILRLSQLGPGSYNLLIHATNADGVWSKTPRKLQINIKPPWYLRWWAYVSYGLIISSTVTLIIWFRIRNARRFEKQQLLIAETETSVLRLQMNPHFIFNSLNSINAYIAKGEPLTAQEYLFKFADLIRDILNRSSQPLTRLEDAIELLENYLTAEQMRVRGLNFVIEGDDELDDFSTYIPTMILQPFVENAILHGIQGKPGGGTVTIRFGYSPDRQQLLLQVEDDGWGLGNTPKVSEKKHESKAMSITRRRLELLNTALQSSLAPAAAPSLPARYEIHDLETENTSGTLVNVYLPLTYPEHYARNSD